MTLTVARFVSLSGLFLLWMTGSACRNGEAPGTGPAVSGSAEAADSKPFQGQTLTLLTWEGYADASFTKGFEEQHAVTVKYTYFASGDELVAKLRAGGSSYDVITPTSDITATLIQIGLVQPIDTTKIAHYKNLYKVLVDRTDVQKDGKVFGVPFTWGPIYLIYNTDAVKEEPRSWNVLFEPEYKGKVSLWDDVASLYVAGQMLGFDRTQKDTLYQMTEEQLEIAKKKLVELKPQVRKYWAHTGELNDLFKKNEVVVAAGWPITPAMLNKQGMKLKGVIPEEGATGWIDRLMIPTSTKHKELAEAYLAYVTAPEVMAIVADVTRHCVANPMAVDHMTDEVKKDIEVEKAEEYLKTLNFWQYVPNRRRYDEVWTEVKSAN